MRFSICESPELRPPSYFLDKIRCQLSRRVRGIASFTRMILSLHSSTYNLRAAVVLSWFCCVLKLLQLVDLKDLSILFSNASNDVADIL